MPSEDSNCYQQLMAMEMQSDLVLHNGPFECAVCLCTYDNNGVVLRDCLHVFCRYETITILVFMLKYPGWQILMILILETLIICGHKLKRFYSAVFLVYDVVEPHR